MWESRRITTLWAFTACYRDSFTFFIESNQGLTVKLCTLLFRFRRYFGLLRWLYTIWTKAKEHECPKFPEYLFAVWWLVYTARNVRPNSVLPPLCEHSWSLRLTCTLHCTSSRFFRLLFLPFTPERRQQEIHLSWSPTTRDQAVGRLLPKHLSCLRAVIKWICRIL
jgi:hypothetical protein